MAIYGSQEKLDSRKSKQMVSSKQRIITTRGVQLHFDLMPHICTENMDDDADIAQILEGGAVKGITQVFRASSDNVHDIRLALQGESTIDSLDDFESYADTAALKVVWIASDTTNTDIYLDTGTVHTGSQSIRVDCRKNKSPGDTITKDYGGGGTDWSAYESLSFWVYNQVDLTCIWKVKIEDTSANVMELQYNQTPNEWIQQNLTLSNFTNFAAVDLTSIRYIRLEMVECTSAFHNFFIDDIELNEPAGDIDIELIDFGSTHPSTSDSVGSPMALDENSNTSITYSLPLIKKEVDLHLHRSAHNYDRAALTVGNYYGLHITNLSTGKCYIYGSGSSKKYDSGSMFTVDVSDVITEVADKTMHFVIYAIQPAYLQEVKFASDVSTGSSKMLIFVIDRETDKIVDCIVRHFFQDEITFEFCFVGADMPLPYLDRQYYLQAYYDDASDSSASAFTVIMKFLFTPVTRYG